MKLSGPFPDATRSRLLRDAHHVSPGRRRRRHRAGLTAPRSRPASFHGMRRCRASARQGVRSPAKCRVSRAASRSPPPARRPQPGRRMIALRTFYAFGCVASTYRPQGMPAFLSPEPRPAPGSRKVSTEGLMRSTWSTRSRNHSEGPQPLRELARPLQRPPPSAPRKRYPARPARSLARSSQRRALPPQRRPFPMPCGGPPVADPPLTPGVPFAACAAARAPPAQPRAPSRASIDR